MLQVMMKEEKPRLNVWTLFIWIYFLIYDPTEPVKPVAKNNQRPNLSPGGGNLKSSIPETDTQYFLSLFRERIQGIWFNDDSESDDSEEDFDELTSTQKQVESWTHAKGAHDAALTKTNAAVLSKSRWYWKRLYRIKSVSLSLISSLGTFLRHANLQDR